MSAIEPSAALTVCARSDGGVGCVVSVLTGSRLFGVSGMGMGVGAAFAHEKRMDMAIVRNSVLARIFFFFFLVPIECGEWRQWKNKTEERKERRINERHDQESGK